MPKRAISLRVSAPNPTSTPSTAARTRPGRRSKSRATRRATDTIRHASDSDITSESLIHRLG